MKTLFASFIVLFSTLNSFAQDIPDSNIVIQYRFEVPRGQDYAEVMRISRFIKAGTLQYVLENGLADDCRSWPDSWGPAKEGYGGNSIPHRVESTILCNEGEPQFENRVLINYEQVTKRFLELSSQYDTYEDYLMPSATGETDEMTVWEKIYNFLSGN